MTHPLFRIIILLTLSAIAAACSDEEADPPEPQVSITDNQPADPAAAEATFQDLSGQAVELTDYHGSKVVVNYWATWCGPCIQELPSLENAADILGEENYVFLLASDESIQEIRDFIMERGFSGNFIKLNGFFATHGVEAVPSTILYNEQGEEVQSWLGEREWDSPEMLDQLRNL